jgi:hypothetical protein
VRLENHFTWCLRNQVRTFRNFELHESNVAADSVKKHVELFVLKGFDSLEATRSNPGPPLQSRVVTANAKLDR